MIRIWEGLDVMELAPVIVLTYKRWGHTKQTLDALANNFLAKATDVYIFSNAPNCEKDNDEIQSVNLVRKSLKQYINKFKTCHIIEREKHLQCNDSICSAIDQVFKEYTKIIIIEDDIITSKNFLNFMNMALDFYKFNLKIWNIVSYNPYKLEIEQGEYDSFITRSFMPWGWGVWKDRWEMVDWDRKREHLLEIDFYDAKLYMPLFELAIKRDIMKGNQYMYWDYIYSCSQLRLKMNTVFPLKSLSRNIGNDGSGETERNIENRLVQIDFQINNDQQKFNFSDIQLTDEIAKEFANSLYYREKRSLENIEAFNKRFWFYIWLSLKNKNISIESYFLKRGFRSVAIYGMGYAGEILYEELSNAKVYVKYVVDRSNFVNLNGIIVHSLNDELENVDVIIVTVTSSFDEIKIFLTKKLLCPIVSLEEVLFQCALDNSDKVSFV